MATWSNLPHDLVASIARRVLLQENFVAFGAVCRSWKSAATRENFTSTHQVPWLMLPETEGTTVRDFYNLQNGKIYRLNLPELVKGKTCYSSFGWLLTLSGKDYSKVDLLHPLNHLHIELPSVEMFINHHPHRRLWAHKVLFGDCIVTKVVLSSSPSFTSDYTVMLHSWTMLAFYKAREREWTIVDTHDGNIDHIYHDVAYYKGQFYVVDSFCSILVCDIEDHKQPKMRIVVPPMAPQSPDNILSLGPFNSRWIYLVESGGTLLIITRSRRGKTVFMIFEVPLNTSDWSQSRVENLGNKTLFLGYNSSFCVEASDYYGCKANCIYFTSHPPIIGGRPEEYTDMGIFHMEDGKTEPHLGKSPNFLGQHLWIEPSF